MASCQWTCANYHPSLPPTVQVLWLSDSPHVSQLVCLHINDFMRILTCMSKMSSLQFNKTTCFSSGKLGNFLGVTICRTTIIPELLDLWSVWSSHVLLPLLGSIWKLHLELGFGWEESWNFFLYNSRGFGTWGLLESVATKLWNLLVFWKFW